jgi:lon-related putative ATP-dependent protease
MIERMTAPAVPIEQLRWNCDPDSLGVESTADVEKLTEKVIAQERAVSALQFGMNMPDNDYNIFVAGESKTGLSHLTRSFLEEASRSEESPPDWCYVHNFQDPDKPKALSIPKGRAKEFAADMAELLEHLKNEIPTIFESDEYRQRRDETVKKFTAQRNAVIAELEKTAGEAGFILNVSQQGMMIVPAKEGRPLTEEDLKELSEEEKSDLRHRSETLQEQMNSAALKIRQLEKGFKEEHKAVDRRVALSAVGFLLEDLQEKYSDVRPILSYLLTVKNDIIKNLDDFKTQEQPQTPFPMPSSEPDFTRYNVNVLVDNTETEGAPVIYETNPTYPNLFGAMERKASFGALFTDFTMIRSGSIHRANGGYLVIKARDLLKWYLSWESLKRALKSREILMEDPAEMMGFITTKGMKPEPIPLKIKIILIGEPYIYHLLYQHDDQFVKLFKVKAHLDDQVERNDMELKKYSSFAARVVGQCGLRHVDKTGLSRLLEYGVELSGRQKKLTLKMAMIRDILREADYWAGEAGADMIRREHVDTAIRQKKFRSALIEERMREHILAGYLNIDTSGHKVGQINGLSVFDLGDYAFGLPSRITAAISLGRQGVVAIDRESKMSGNIHTKGVLIMEGYLRGRYAQDRPLSLSASLVFEQTYGMVDGDSASAAELFVLLSRLTDIPINQSLAVTGAISQQGEVQPIGGVNQKIEGFFEVSIAQGLTGEQGVIIPKANVPDLMLKGQVIEAVRQGRFKIYAVKHVDEALELLMGLPVGERSADGAFPEGTINRIIEDKLAEFAEKSKRLAKEDGIDRRPEDDGAPGCDSCKG